MHFYLTQLWCLKNFYSAAENLMPGSNAGPLGSNLQAEESCMSLNLHIKSLKDYETHYRISTKIF